MTAYSRRGFRVRLILEDYDDHRKKCYFFVNVLREKLVRNVIQRIWHFFYQELCSTPDELFLEIEDFFIPAGESTLVLKENDVISVRIRPQPAGGRAAGAVRSTVAPLTAAPGTLVESVALVLRRLQDGAGPDDSERTERLRLNKVAEMMAAESGSTDVSTDEDGVRDLASQLTSRQEVVRLSQKMADQATPPPPCSARKHNLDSEQLTLTETSRELRRRYEATRQEPPAAPAPASAAAASPVRTADSLDSTSPTVTTETPGASTETTGTATSTPLTTLSAAARRGPAGVIVVRKPTRGCGGGERAMREADDVDSGAAVRPVAEASSSVPKPIKVTVMPRLAQKVITLMPGDAQKVITLMPGDAQKIIKFMPPGARSSAPSVESGVPRSRTAPGAPNVIILTAEDAKKNRQILAAEDAKKRTENKTGEGSQAVKIIRVPMPLTAAKGTVQQQEGQRPPPAIVKRDVTAAKSGEKPLDRSRDEQGTRDVKRRDTPVAGLKRARSPSSESSSEASSEEDSSVKSTPAKKPTTTPATSAAAGVGVSAEKKKKTRTRRRRGKKRRTPEPPLAPPPPPQPRPTDYAKRHGLPRADIDRYKRAASVGIGWQTRPKNRRVVFDDDGNPVATGADPPPAPAAATGRKWRGAPAEGGSQWAWSQGQRQEQGTGSGRSGGGGWSRPDDRMQNTSDQSGNSLATGDRSGNVSATTDQPGNPTSTENGAETPSLSARDNRPVTQDTATANTPTFKPPDTPSHSTPALPAVSGTTASLSRRGRAGEQPLPSPRTGDTTREDSAWTGNSALGAGGGRKSGSLGAGLLPRAFMRPLRCINPPRRSEVLRGPPTAASTAAAETERTSAAGGGAVSGGSAKLLQPAYLMASRAATAASAAAAAGRGTKRAQAGVKNDSSIAATSGWDIGSDAGDDAVSSGVSLLPTSSLPAQESSSGQTPCRVHSAATSTPTSATVALPTSVAVPPSSTSSPAHARTPAPAPAPASHGTVVLDGSGRPAEASVARDLRHLATSTERRPLVVVRRDRPLPGRAPYREVTRQDSGTPRRDTGKAAGTGSSIGTGIRADKGAGVGGDVRCGRDGDGGASRAREGNSDGDGGDGLDGRNGRGGSFDMAADSVGEDVEDDTDAASSPSGDVYRNVSVILPGPPLETLSPCVAESAEDSEDSQDEEDSEDEEEDSEESADAQDSGDEAEALDQSLLAADARAADASVDSIGNCNVVNAVGQNRRLEKQRARGLPPGGDKENQAPTGAVKDDKFYAQFPLMKEVARKRDLIAFKCWDMAADYSPYVSEYREATVMDVTEDKQGGGRLKLQLLKYRPHARRRGRFEISTAEDDEVVDLEEESGIEERCWTELIQPRLLHP